MTSREFCYWLQGYFEIAGVKPGTAGTLTNAQTDMVVRHLQLVFKHEIDPSYPDGAGLDAIHTPRPPGHGPDLIRC